MGFLRLNEAASILEVAPPTLRLWCNQGKIPYHKNVSGQRVFNKEEIEEYKRKKLGEPKPEPTKIFYTRTSNKQDISLQNQYNKLEQTYGKPEKTFTDTASGLNDKRKGLNQLIQYCKKNNNNTIYITNKDRLTRFGYTYLKELFEITKTQIIILDSEDTKEPLEILLQDFMSLLASFSGKYYRIRGWKQQKQFLNKINKEVQEK